MSQYLNDTLEVEILLAPANHILIREVKKTIMKYNMILPGELIIVAVSGGPDSICLVDILACLSKEMETTLVIAHFEHGLRPEEDTYETGMVREYARSLNVPFETERAFGLSPVSSSLEERARELRYDFLERMRKKHNAHKIAMGHNLNDQAETVLMRLLRGSGMTGLSGIPPVRDNTVVRPLIETRREDIIDYLESGNFKYATDSSNRDNRFLRNKIRMELLPEMIKYQPGLIEILGKLARNLRDENSFFESLTEKWVDEQLERDESGDPFLDIHSLKDLPDAFLRRILRNTIKRHNKTLYAIQWDHVQDIIDLISNKRPNISINLPEGLIIRKEYNRLVFTSTTACTELFSYTIGDRGRINIHEIGKTVGIEEFGNKEQAAVPGDKNTALLDKDLLPYPLTIRNFRPGDRFIPLGMTGHKKVKNFFIDLKIPPAERKQIPILVKDDKIAWICGYRIDDRFRVTERTKRILKISLYQAFIT